MKLYRNFVAFAFLTLVLTSLAFAQGPLLSDGSSPLAMGFQGGSAQSALPSNDLIPQSQLVTPEQLNHTLKTAKQKPLILNVGPRSMFSQARIPGAEYMGAGSSDAGQQMLRDRVKSLPKNSAIVIYCGCCPWGHCPNMHPAYQLLHSMGFTNVKAIYIANDFGTDWVNQGYPVVRGE
jgi:thiosulfate/3-mercaptopyruvate sulfurtransferase